MARSARIKEEVVWRHPPFKSWLEIQKCSDNIWALNRCICECCIETQNSVAASIHSANHFKSQEKLLTNYIILKDSSHEYFINRRWFLGVEGELVSGLFGHLIRSNYSLQPKRHPHSLLLDQPFVTALSSRSGSVTTGWVGWDRKSMFCSGLHFCVITGLMQVTLQLHKALGGEKGFLVVCGKPEDEFFL